MSVVEAFAPRRAGLGQFWSDLSPTAMVNALVGFIFAATGPLAVVLTVGTQGGLDQATLSSWVFGSFYINGLLSIIACWLYRMPMVFFWTIPGTVLVGPALTHLSFAEVVGAFYATGLLMFVLGWTGLVRKVMQAVPMPIVMGMVAGVFLKFGLDWIHALRDDMLLAGFMTVTFVTLSSVPGLSRRMPPLIGALIAGVAVIFVSQTMSGADTTMGNGLATAFAAAESEKWFGGPRFIAPAFSWQAMLELVVPLAITVLVVQNGQGTAVLKQAGHNAPINFTTMACGLWSMIGATAGSVSTCLTGPVNALISSSGPRSSHYAAGIMVGLLAVVFGLFAPGFTKLLLASPPAFIATLAGLAMLRVLQGAFTVAFNGRFQTGALISFLITVSGVTLMSIGAPFWGLVIGYGLSWLMERGDHKASTPAER